MENDQNLWSEFVLKQASAFAVEIETSGKLLAQQNLTAYETAQTSVIRLADQIDRNQSLVQAYLNKAVTEIGQNSQHDNVRQIGCADVRRRIGRVSITP